MTVEMGHTLLMKEYDLINMRSRALTQVVKPLFNSLKIGN